MYTPPLSTHYSSPTLDANAFTKLFQKAKASAKKIETAAKKVKGVVKKGQTYYKQLIGADGRVQEVPITTEEAQYLVGPAPVAAQRPPWVFLAALGIGGYFVVRSLRRSSKARP